MIHVNYSLTKKDYKKCYYQTMTLSYMKIYFVVLLLAIVVTKLLGMMLGSEGLQSTSLSLLMTFIPTLFLCLCLSVGISYFELRKIEKRHPETMEGNIKVRFEKKFIIWQINGTNNKLTYNGFTIRKGLNNSLILSNIEYKNIVIPQNLLKKEQIKQIKANAKD